MHDTTQTDLCTVLAAFTQHNPDTPFETDLGLALMVAEKLQSQGYTFSLKDRFPKDMTHDQWVATFTDEQGNVIQEEHENAATAISRAAFTILSASKP